MPRALLLHGFTGSAGSWGPVRPRLEAAGIATHALDLPGHGLRAGEHDPARFTLGSVLREIRDACSDRSNWTDEADEPAWVVGYSMGGRLALHHALEFPDRLAGVVLESASPGLATAAERAVRREADESLARGLESDGVEGFVDRWERLPLFESQQRLDAVTRGRVREQRLTNEPRSLAASLRGFGTGQLPSLWGRLSEVRVPVLLLVGSLDAKFVDIAARMTSEVPDATMSIVEGAGHNVHLEMPDAWCRAVASFVTARSM